VCPKLKIAARGENNRLEKVCFVAQDGTDSKKTNKYGCSWNAFDRLPLKMTKRNI